MDPSSASRRLGQWSDCMRRGLFEHVRAVAEEAGTCWQRSDVTGRLGLLRSSQAACFEMKRWLSLVSTVWYAPGEGLPELCTHPYPYTQIECLGVDEPVRTAVLTAVVSFVLYQILRTELLTHLHHEIHTNRDYWPGMRLQSQRFLYPDFVCIPSFLLPMTSLQGDYCKWRGKISKHIKIIIFQCPFLAFNNLLSTWELSFMYNFYI